MSSRTAGTVRLQQGLQAVEQEPVRLPSSHHPKSHSGQQQPPDKADPIAERLLNICKNTDKGTDSNIFPLLESDIIDLKETITVHSSLQTPCDDRSQQTSEISSWD